MTDERWEAELGLVLRGTGWIMKWPRVAPLGETAFAVARHPETGRSTPVAVKCDFSTSKASRRLDVLQQLGIEEGPLKRL